MSTRSLRELAVDALLDDRDYLGIIYRWRTDRMTRVPAEMELAAFENAKMREIEDKLNSREERAEAVGEVHAEMEGA